MDNNNIQEIKDRLPVMDVLADYIQMKKAGTNYKAVCPFHNEKSASLMISPSKQIWHCFGCGLGGDIFEFVKLSENVEFGEALKILADRAGVELKKPSQAEIKTSEKKHTLYDINQAAARYFSKVMWESRAGNEALLYLRGRGLTDQTIKNWQLGFAPDDFHYLENFLTKTYPKDDVILAGLMVKKDDGKSYDRFRGRVMFPILNIHGQVVGFTGRILKDEKNLPPGKDPAAKYVNSPETPVYNKSRELFGLFHAKNQIRKENRVVVVEGNMDVISSHQAGFNQTVASSGTALTAQQLQTIKRFTENLIFAFDTDAAGSAATRRALEEALNQGFNVKIADMKNAKDPDELIKKGIGLWKKSVDTAQNYIDYFFEKRIEESMAKVEDKMKIANELENFILKLQSSIARGHYVRKLSEMLNISEGSIWEDINDIIKHRNPEKPKKVEKIEEKRKSRREILEDQLLGMSLTTKDFSHLKDFAAEDFLPENVEVFKLLMDRGAITPKAVEQTDPNLASKLELLLFASQVDLPFGRQDANQQNWKPEVELLRIKAELKKYILKEQMQSISEQLKAAERSQNKELLAQLSGRFTKLSQEVQQYNN